MSENVAELLTLIERLREEIRHLRATLDDQHVRMDAVQARELFLLGRSSHSSDREAAEAMRRGTLAPHPADDEPGNYTHDVAPNAPR